MDKIMAVSGAALGFLGVALGAFGAHGLKKYFLSNPDLQPIFKTAVEYQMIHALSLLATAWAFGRWPSAAVSAAGWLFIAGVILFSGSLYVISLARIKSFGAVAPVGGLALLAGWLCLAIGVWAGPRA